MDSVAAPRTTDRPARVSHAAPCTAGAATVPSTATASVARSTTGGARDSQYPLLLPSRSLNRNPPPHPTRNLLPNPVPERLLFQCPPSLSSRKTASAEMSPRVLGQPWEDAAPSGTGAATTRHTVGTGAVKNLGVAAKSLRNLRNPRNLRNLPRQD